MKHLCFLTLLLLPRLCAAATGPFECSGKYSGDAAQAVARIEERYRSITSLSGQFRQNSYFIGLDKREQSRGEIFFEKPGKMAWLYREPEPQEFISDGSTVSFYQPGLKQVTLTEFQNSFQTDLPVTFLLGIGNLSDSFVKPEICKAEKSLLFAFRPAKPDSHLDTFFLAVDPETSVPNGAKTRDIGGNETEIILEDLKTNAAIPAERFKADFPRGIDVIDRRAVAENFEETK